MLIHFVHRFAKVNSQKTLTNFAIYEVQNFRHKLVPIHIMAIFYSPHPYF